MKIFKDTLFSKKTEELEKWMEAAQKLKLEQIDTFSQRCKTVPGIFQF